MSETQDQTELMLAIIYASTETSGVKWKEAASMLDIQDQPTLTGGAKLQRKFKKIVESSDRYSLEKGKLVLKHGSTSTLSTPNTANTPVTPSTPKASSAPKKRGRPAGTSTAHSTKKAKKAAKEEVDDNVDDEVAEGLQDNKNDDESDE